MNILYKSLLITQSSDTKHSTDSTSTSLSLFCFFWDSRWSSFPLVYSILFLLAQSILVEQCSAPQSSLLIRRYFVFCIWIVSPHFLYSQLNLRSINSSSYEAWTKTTRSSEKSNGNGYYCLIGASMPSQFFFQLFNTAWPAQVTNYSSAERLYLSW